MGTILEHAHDTIMTVTFKPLQPLPATAARLALSITLPMDDNSTESGAVVLVRDAELVHRGICGP